MKRPEHKSLQVCCLDPRTFNSYELGYNKAIDDMTAWLSEFASVERIAEVIEKWETHDTCPLDGSKVSWEEWKNAYATAIHDLIVKGE